MQKVTKKQNSDNNNGKSLIPEKYQDYFYIGLLILSVFVFFWGVLSSYEIFVSDNLASYSFKTYLSDAASKGKFPLWIPYIFSGLPGYASLMVTGERTWDFIYQIFFGFTNFFGQLFNNDSARVITYYWIFGIGMYLLMKSKKHDRFVSFFTAIAAIFSTGIIHWVMIGHNTKPITMSLIPFVFLLLERLRKEFRLLDAVLMIIVMHLMLESTHIQLMFYAGCAVGLYFVFELISRAISKNQPIKILVAAAVMIVAVGLAFLLSSDRYLAIREYTNASVRGSSPIMQTESNKVDKDGGNSYDYATGWSFSPQEIITFAVPNYYGFGKLPYSGPATGDKEQKIPTYWGQKPFEDVAPYMGIIILFLGVYGFIKNRNVIFVQFLFVLSIFALFLSFGRNLSFLYDIFYYHVPSFNKFRAPSMALILMQFAFPILAGYGLTSLIKSRNENIEQDKKGIMYFLYASLGFFGIGLVFAATMKNFYISSMENSANQSFKSVLSQLPDLTDFVWSQMIGDWLLVGAILVIFATLALLYYKRTITPTIFFASAAILLIFDLWRVGYRPLELSTSDQTKEYFQQNDLVNFIHQDKDKFRVADFAMANISPNMTAFYRLENVGGYHPAKVRSYQDIMDFTSQGSTNAITSPFMWNLLNVKYIIADRPLGNVEPIFKSQQTGWMVFANPSFMPRAFFAKSYQISDAKSTLEHLQKGDFNPKDIVYLEKEPGAKIDTIDGTESVKITNYQNEFISLNTNNKGNNLLFMSEVYYPQGWKAYIDGKETQVLRANHSFRALVVPAGNHNIEFKFTSEGFESGKMYSTITNYAVILLLGVALFFNYKKKKSIEVTNYEAE